MRSFEKLKIAVAGTGYVGLSIAILLAQHHQVIAVDVIPEKVDLINQRKSPIQDDYIEKYLAEKELNLIATLDATKAYSEVDFVVIAAPTNYDPLKNYFDPAKTKKKPLSAPPRALATTHAVPSSGATAKTQASQRASRGLKSAPITDAIMPRMSKTGQTAF